jgi:hypothetical protein
LHPEDVNVNINGYGNSTNITSLGQAFESLALDAVLPGLTSDLLSKTSLKGFSFFLSLVVDEFTCLIMFFYKF